MRESSSGYLRLFHTLPQVASIPIAQCTWQAAHGAIPSAKPHRERGVSLLQGLDYAVVLARLGAPLPLALVACGGITFALRAGSLHFGWCLPVYKSRARRH
jgi:hypothetical protein